MGPYFSKDMGFSGKNKSFDSLKEATNAFNLHVTWDYGKHLLVISTQCFQKFPSKSRLIRGCSPYHKEDLWLGNLSCAQSEASLQRLF